MLNLHELVRPLISLSHPDQEVEVLRCTGQKTDDSGRVRPVYAAPKTVRAQVQPAPDPGPGHAQGLERNTVRRHMYLNGDWSGLCRNAQSSGALVRWNGQTWRVDQVAQGFGPSAGWTLVSVTLQVMDPAAPDPAAAPEPQARDASASLTAPQ